MGSGLVLYEFLNGTVFTQPSHSCAEGGMPQPTGIWECAQHIVQYCNQLAAGLYAVCITGSCNDVVQSYTACVPALHGDMYEECIRAIRRYVMVHVLHACALPDRVGTAYTEAYVDPPMQEGCRPC